MYEEKAGGEVGRDGWPQFFSAKEVMVVATAVREFKKKIFESGRVLEAVENGTGGTGGCVGGRKVGGKGRVLAGGKASAARLRISRH